MLYPFIRSSVSLAHPGSEQVQLHMMCVCVCVCVWCKVCVGLTDSDSGVKMRGLHFQTVAVFLCPLAMRVTILMFPTILRLCHFMWARGAGSRPTAPGSAPSPLAVHRFPLSLRDPCLGVPRPGILLLSLWVKLGESLRFAQRSLHAPGGCFAFFQQHAEASEHL